MAKKAGNRRKRADSAQVVISRQDLEAIAQGTGESLRVRIASREKAWSIFRDAFNAVLPGLLPDDMPAAPTRPNISPVSDSAPNPQGARPPRTRRTSKRRNT